MTNYKKVVYLDADTIVVKSMEDLLECSKFCANLKHSERLNSGVMVVEPSERMLQDMMRKVTTLESDTGGDHGFLKKRSKIIEIVAARDIVFALAQSGFVQHLVEVLRLLIAMFCWRVRWSSNMHVEFMELEGCSFWYACVERQPAVLV